MSAFTPAQVAELTDIIGRRVPNEYLAFMATYPADLVTRCYPGVAGLISDYELYGEPARVLDANRMVREEDIWAAEGPWAESHLVFGMDIGGDVVAIHLDVPGLPIDRLLTEVAQLKRVAPNVGAWARTLASR